jgi:hypothetical protein
MLCDGRKYLWLKSCRVDSVCVEAFHDNLCLVGKVLDCFIINHNVRRCNRFMLIKTPDVELVYGLNTGYLSLLRQTCPTAERVCSATYHFNVMFDIFQIDISRGNLQEYAAAMFSQRDCGQNDHDGNEDANSRISIESCIALRLPYD